MASRGGSREVQSSKALSYLLRHGAEKEGLKMTKGESIDHYTPADAALIHILDLSIYLLFFHSRRVC